MLRLVLTVMHSFHQSKDTRESNEASSLHVMIRGDDLWIEGLRGKQKNQQGF
jgi:hypothetical protein